MFGRKFKKPELTLPPEESACIRSAYADAKVILEYGSGGSTVIAAEGHGKNIFSVESDRKWAAGLRSYLDQAGLSSPVQLHHADIGRTRKWGHPSDDTGIRRYAEYPLGVWNRDDFVQPDVVLIDGRFRVGCFLATLFRTKAPLTVYFDDYGDRPGYHVVEEFVERAEMYGRMARFEVVPTLMQSEDLIRIVAYLQDPA